MLGYNKFDISECIAINKISDSHECKVCHYWYFFRINVIYQALVCNDCHDLMQISMSLIDVTILTVGKKMFIGFIIGT